MKRRSPYKPRPMPPEFRRMMALWTHFVEQAKPRGRCRWCALRPGTPANRCGLTAGKLADVILRGGDFRCHHETLNGRVVKEAPARQCRGFRVLIHRLRDRDELAAELPWPTDDDAGLARTTTASEAEQLAPICAAPDPAEVAT